MTQHRALLPAILVYVSLDLSLPGMPGAFVFESSETVDRAQGNRGRATAVAVIALGSVDHAVLPSLTIASDDRPLPSSGDPFVIRPVVKREAAMAKVGPFVTDPRAGAYCQIVLDSGEKVLVNHDKGGAKGGRVTIEVTKFMGFSSDRIFACELDDPEGKAVLATLTREAQPGGVDATPLGAFVNCVTACASVADVKARCARLTTAG